MSRVRECFLFSLWLVCERESRVKSFFFFFLFCPSEGLVAKMELVCWICQNDDFLANEKKGPWQLSVEWVNSCFGRENDESDFSFLDFSLLFCVFFFLPKTNLQK